MTLRQTILAASAKAKELTDRLLATSNKAVKTRERLLAELREELENYLTTEEQHLLPLLGGQGETKKIALNVSKANRQIRAKLNKVVSAPISEDGFLIHLKQLSKRLQLHLRDDRTDLIPAVLTAVTDEDARALEATIEEERKAAEKAKRDEKREEARKAARVLEQAAEAQKAVRAAKRTEKAAERRSREISETIIASAERNLGSVVEAAQQVTEAEMGVLPAAEETTSIALYRGPMEEEVENKTESSPASVVRLEAMTEFPRALLDWFGKIVRANAVAGQKLIECRSPEQLGELQRDYIARAMRQGIEGAAQLLEMTARLWALSLNEASPLLARGTSAPSP